MITMETVSAYKMEINMENSLEKELAKIKKSADKIKQQLEQDTKKYNSFEEHVEGEIVKMRMFLNTMLAIIKEYEEWAKNPSKESIPPTIAQFIFDEFAFLELIFKDRTGYMSYKDVYEAAQRVDGLIRFEKAIEFLLTDAIAKNSWEKMKESLSLWKEVIKKGSGKPFENTFDKTKKAIEAAEKRIEERNN